MFVAFSAGIGEDTFSHSVWFWGFFFLFFCFLSFFYCIVYEARTGQRECVVV